MKNWKILLLSITIFINTSFAAPNIIDKVVAIVNDDVVLESDVDSLTRLIKTRKNYLGQKVPDDTTLHHQVIENCIMDQIILQVGKKIGIKISSNDEHINQATDSPFRGNNKNINQNQIQNVLVNNGVSYSNNYLKQIQKEILISKILDREISHRVVISPQEVENLSKQISSYYDDNTKLNLSYILIPTPKHPTPKQVKTAEKLAYFLIKKARNGNKFNKLAITYSTNQQVIKSIQIGWIRIQELPSIFFQTLVLAKKGDIIGPIRSIEGFHILRINDLQEENKNIFVTEVRASHILIRPSFIMTDDQVRTKLEKIAINIKKGKISFANAAKKFSQDLNSSSQEGDLGWSIIDIYDPVFRDTLMKLKKGQISIPIRSSFGWHLIKLLDVRNTNKKNVVQKYQSYRLLFNKKFFEETLTWMQEQRAKTYVKILN